MRLKLFILLALITVLVFLLSSCSNGEGFPITAFPASKLGSTNEDAAQVNVYIQATSDMSDYFNSDSYYSDAVKALINTVDWGIPNSQSSFYRFDILWREFSAEAERERGAFAYPLDPDWWDRPSNLQRQSAQILEESFYDFNWYVNQTGRGVPAYEEHISYLESLGEIRTNDYFISQTLNEISDLRSSNSEISVMITNFEGHPQESLDVQSVILDYLQENPLQRAIGVFAFENDNEPFYFLVLGSIDETIEFCSSFKESVDSIAFQFQLFTKGSVVTSPSYNSQIAMPITTFPGVRLAYQGDLLNAIEKSHFSTNNSENWLLYKVYSQLLDRGTAPLQLDVDLGIPDLVKEQVLVDAEVYDIKHLSEFPMQNIDIGSSSKYDAYQFKTESSNDYATVEVNDKKNINELSDDLVRLNIGLNTINMVKNSRLLLNVHIYAFLIPDININQFNGNFNSEFLRIFNQLALNIEGEYKANTDKPLAGELFVHLIYE